MGCLYALSAEAVFENPMKFDIHRANAREHLAFGIGAHLARMELKAFLQELLPRIEKIELAGEVAQMSTTFVDGLKFIPIRYALR